MEAKDVPYRSLNQYLEIIGWNKVTLADRLHVSLRVILRWANGQNETPEAVLEWLAALATPHIAFPLPIGWHPETHGQRVANGH